MTGSLSEVGNFPRQRNRQYIRNAARSSDSDGKRNSAMKESEKRVRFRVRHPPHVERKRPGSCHNRQPN